MRLRLIKEARVKDKKVLLRCGFDVPFDKKGKIKDDSRIRAALETIKLLLKSQAKIIIISHNGRPGGKRVVGLGMAQVGQRLSQLLKIKVKVLNDCLGPKVNKAVGRLKAGEIILLENLRFHPGEEKNDQKFSRELAGLADLYCNDAFANSHRNHASMVGVPRFLPSYAGLLLAEEVGILSEIMIKPKRPLVGIIGGAKISTKLPVIKNLLTKADFLLLGGALANTILKAQGLQVGRSLIEKKMVKLASELVLTENRLKIPLDVVVATEISDRAKTYCRPAGRVAKEEIILDIGPETVSLYCSIIKKAKSVVWNGPMGYFEINKFSRGTYDIARAVSRSGLESIVGGGETIEVIKKINLLKKFTYVSTGGGAMLELLAGKKLKAIELLKTKK